MAVRRIAARRAVRWLTLALACCIGLLLATAARADVPELVGKVAAAITPEGAAAAGLSDETVAKLKKLVDERIDAGSELLLSTKDLPEAEKEAQFAPFRAETEKQAQALVTAEEWQKIGQFSIRQNGLFTLADAAVAEQLALSELQKSNVTRILADYNSEVGAADEPTRATLKAQTDRRLRFVLKADQWAKWQEIAGEVPAAAAPATASTEVKTEPAPMTGAAPAPEGVDPRGPATDRSTGSGPATAAPGSPAAPAEAKTATPIGTPAIVGPDGEVRLKFNFRYQPWADVLDWFAKQADLSLVIDAPPPGTFNYIDTKSYTPAQAIDLLNGVLLTKGYTLVRRERMLMLINLEDGIPANLVPYITLAELDKKGEFELVKVLFPLTHMTPADAEVEIKALLGPQGAIVPLVRAKQLLITETAGRLRTIRAVIEAMEHPEGKSDIKVFTLEHAPMDQVVELIKQFLDIPADRSATLDGSIRFAIDLVGNRLIVSGTPEKITRIEELIKVTDIPSATTEVGTFAIETPQLEVYAVAGADPNTVLQVLQTLLAGLPDVRLATDPKTGNIIANARPSEHATIRATLAQMQRDARKVEVLRLRNVDVQLAVLAITKLFGAQDEKNPTAPTIDSDPISGQLLIRATEAQLAQIRELLEKMGETGATDPSTDVATTSGGNLRMIPLSGRTAKSAMEQIQVLWPTMRTNRIRIVKPGETIPATGDSDAPAAFDPSAFESGGDRYSPGGSIRSSRIPDTRSIPRDVIGPKSPTAPAQPLPLPQQPGVIPMQPGTQPTTGQPAPTGQPMTQLEELPRRVVVPAMLVSLLAQSATKSAGESATDEPAAGAVAQPQGEPAADPAEPPAPIYIAPGANGLIIASDDLEALDEFEALLKTLTSKGFTGGREFTIFYLKSANAVAVAETLELILTGSSSSSDGGSGGGGGLLGDMASMALGGMGGGLFGGLLGGGGGGETEMAISSGTLRIVPETRLNALVVQGTPNDIDTVEQLLQVLDQGDAPDNDIAPKPRLIAVKNMPAAEIAETIRQVYADRITGATGGQQRQPSPQEFIALLRGGRGGRGGGGGGGQRTQAEATKMTLGVDTRTNSLIVAAPASLFTEVEELVATLDLKTEDNTQTMKVVTLKRGNAYAVQTALQAITGQQVRGTNAAPRPPVGQQPTTSGRPTTGRGTTGQPGGNFGNFMEMMQRAAQQGGGSRGQGGTQGRGSFGGGSRGGR